MDGSVRTIWSDYDPAWWSPTRGPATVVSPDGEMVAFFSDRTGWTHLYVAPTAPASASKPKALTSGLFTVGYPAWSPDSKRLAYGHGSPGNQMERLVSIVDVDSGRSESIVSSRGVQIAPMFSPDGTTVALSTCLGRALARLLRRAGPLGRSKRAADRFDAGKACCPQTSAPPLRSSFRAASMENLFRRPSSSRSSSIAPESIRRSCGFTDLARIRTFSDGIQGCTGCTTPCISTSRSRAT